MQYEFKSLTNLSESFRTLRKFALGAIVVSGVVSISCLVAFFVFAQKEREKIYVLDEGKSLILALSQDAEANRPVEAKEHLRRFHSLFYTLSPDPAGIESNINKALKMADKSVLRLYDDLAEKGYYNNIVSGGVIQRVEIDSIHVDFNQHPYRAQTYATQYITRKGRVTKRNLVTACKLRNTIRSVDNPQGFRIEDYIVVDNSDKYTKPTMSLKLREDNN